MEIHQCIKNARLKEKLSQEELAEQLGVTRQTISSWETAKSYPDIISVIKMSDIFDISLDKMLKEDKKLIENMQSQMNTTKNHQSLVLTLLCGFMMLGSVYFIRTFVDIPKIENLFANILVLIIFIIGTIAYLLSNISIRKFLNQKTSNKTIVKTMIAMISILSLFLIFPIFENLTLVDWQIFVLRIITLAVLLMICLLTLKAIDKK